MVGKDLWETEMQAVLNSDIIKHVRWARKAWYYKAP